MEKVILVGGGKGGVGKSTVTMAVIDAILAKHGDVILVESDDSNPDAYKAFKSVIQCQICNLDDQAGWIALGELIEREAGKTIVVNTAARATDNIVEHTGIVCDTCKESGHDLTMLWPINRQRDSLELLKKVSSIQEVFNGGIYVVVNTYFGKSEKFTRYHNSALKKAMTGTIELPELDDDTTDIIIENRLTLATASEKLTTAKRSALHKYRLQIHEAFDGVIK